MKNLRVILKNGAEFIVRNADPTIVRDRSGGISAVYAWGRDAVGVPKFLDASQISAMVEID